MALSSNEENVKLGQKDSCEGHVTHFWNFGTPGISVTVEARNIKFGMDTDGIAF